MPKLTLEQKEILREVRLALQKADKEGYIITDITFEVIDEVERNYGKK
jgi:hypothetical protein